MKLYRGFATVGGMTVISRLLGFVRDILIAAVLGASAISDAFFVALRVPNMFRRIFAEGAFNAAFIPLYTKKLHEAGEEAAKEYAARALAGLSALLVLLVILAIIAAPWLVMLLAPGFAEDPDKFSLTVLLVRIAMPYLLFMSWVALYTGLLNTLGKFAAAAFAPSILNFVLITVLLGLIATGHGQDSVAGIAMAWGVAVSGFLQVCIVVFAAFRAGLRLRLAKPEWSDDMKRLVHLAIPGVIAGGVGQIALVIATIVASLEDGVVSWLYYADRIFQLPLGLIGVAVGVVLLPDLSHKLRSGDREAASDSENRALEFSLLMTVPAAVALYLCAEPIMRVLFERGAFSASDARASAMMLAMLSFGLPAYVVVKVLQPSFFAREDTKTPMLYSGLALVGNAVLSPTLFYVVGPQGIALATSLVGWINVALLAFALRRRKQFVLDHKFRRAFRGIIIASIAMALGLWATAYVLEPYFAPSNGLLIQVASLAALIAVGVLLYFGVGSFVGALKPRTFVKDVLGR
jgi:putative peptidoglycan lipid II flippase